MVAKKVAIKKSKQFSDTSIYGNLQTLIGSFFNVYENFRRDIRNIYGSDMLRFLEQARDNMYFSYSSTNLQEKMIYGTNTIKEINKFELRVCTLVSPNVRIITISTASNLTKQIGEIKTQLNSWITSLQAKMQNEQKYDR
jgi:hypothetical protein